MGALKSALTAIFNANNYTSATSGIASKKIPVNESNGLPSGQIGMSDLASVLGVAGIKIVSSGDLNDLTATGEYYLPTDATSYTNLPSNANVAPRAHLSVFRSGYGSIAYIYQKLHSAGVYPNRVWYRTNGGAAWTSWAQVTMTDV